MLFPSVIPSEIWSARTNKFNGLNRKEEGIPPMHNPKPNMQRVQQSQDNMSPEWQELLFASVEVINDGSLAGSGSRWALSPWQPVPVSSLQAALANAGTSAMSRHECQPGMWWHSTIPPGKTPSRGGKRGEKKGKEEGLRKVKGKKKKKKKKNLNKRRRRGLERLYQ